MRVEIELEVNGTRRTAAIRPHDRLLDLLRDRLGLTGTKEGCSEGECGACTVMVDGRIVNACLYPAMEAEGRRVLTIEGLGGPGAALSPVQQAFVEEGGVQCGFCTPGMVLAAAALLEETPDPSDEEIRRGLAGNLCRCTGYAQIIRAVRRAAAAPRRGTGAAQEEARA